jgi:N-acetyl-gamma-glutamylphosphate reductase
MNLNSISIKDMIPHVLAGGHRHCSEICTRAHDVITQKRETIFTVTAVGISRPAY